VDEARARLVVERAEALERLEAMRRELASMVEAADTATDDEHDPEGVTAFERAQTRSLIDATERRLTELDHVEARLAAGTYERCERCGGPIGAERLEARPATTLCLECAATRRR
jgi:RNA polymerase-binding transcription factor DksA